MDTEKIYSMTSNFGTPFMHVTVEQLVKVKSTEFWTNNNIRVLGRLYYDEKDPASATLVSPIKSHEKDQIKLDLSFLKYFVPQGRLLEVYGYFDVIPRYEPVLKALKINTAYGINVPLYYKTIKIRSKYVPKFNDENDDTSFICSS